LLFIGFAYKKKEKNRKKGVDKGEMVWYINKAAPRTAELKSERERGKD
jgi:hypothetical protein